jgi:signal peptidase I
MPEKPDQTTEEGKKEIMDFISEQEQETNESSVKDFFIELLQVVIVALAIIIPVRYYFIKPFYVKGASMEPSFYDNEYLVIDEISYRFKEPLRGEIVVFRYPRDPKQFFIKRIVGLPGETVQITGSDVFINGEELNEIYLNPDTQTKGEIVVTLQSDEYFVLGDNRSFSLDSRSFGPLKQEFIVGRTWIRGWPFDKITVFEPPQYNLEQPAPENN